MAENKKLFVITNAAIKNSAIEFIRALPIDEKTTLQVVIQPYKKKRTNQQNDTYWGRLTDISEQVVIEGRRFNAESWHELMKQNLLPETCAKGVDKWRYLPNGDRRLAMSTSDLSTKEFYDYRLQVEAEGAEMGVRFTTREII